MKGVVVTEVEPASFAEDINFAPGDVIAEVNGQFGDVDRRLPQGDLEAEGRR